MKSPLDQAKELKKQLENEGSVDALHRLSEFMSVYTGENEVVSSEDLLEEVKQFENEERFEAILMFEVESENPTTEELVKKYNEIVMAGIKQKDVKILRNYYKD
jgi:hypothetical protein